MLSKDLLKAYRQRWQAVEEIEKEEAQKASFELRWKQLNVLVQLGLRLKLLPRQDEADLEIIQRWNRLKSLQ